MCGGVFTVEATVKMCNGDVRKVGNVDTILKQFGMEWTVVSQMFAKTLSFQNKVSESFRIFFFIGYMSRCLGECMWEKGKVMVFKRREVPSGCR